MATSTKQIQEEITKKIIESLKEGTIPWRKPWSTSPNIGTPTNLVSGKAYRGINPLLLALHQDQHGFSSKWYATFNQWRDLGARVEKRPDHVKPGEWGAGIIFYAPITKTKEDPTTGEEIEVQFAMLKQYTVFSAEQVELPSNLRHLVDVDPETKNDEFVDFATAEVAIAATEANIKFGGDKCFYSLSTDHIQMVKKERFEKEKEYYSTLLHELSHWSEKRCEWTGSYAEGELRAEISAAFMCSELQIPQSDDLTNTQAYLQSWLKSLENDPRFIFKASSAASKASDYVLSFSRKEEPVSV
ncbi:ArdC family protein [Bremerella sp. T1]|uniref:ArdC family protein n=1 Tax=Bremerella sp. TYQ1 TaxID=3119568 RepID=UPI001CC9AD09|nr:ArdC-like ssDNA-binding domain-containing protein [Bremerella volcania]UBM35318.1 ssDNA-binding domain-containing protein [Bremerella volcania]